MTAKQGLIPLIKSIAQTIASRLSPGANINGVLFDGSADITVPAAAGTLTGTTLASNVVNASLNAITPSGGTLAVTGTSTASSGFSLVSTNGFGDMRLLQAAGGTGWRHTLNNDGTLLVQRTTNGFTSATTFGTWSISGLAITGMLSATGQISSTKTGGGSTAGLFVSANQAALSLKTLTGATNGKTWDWVADTGSLFARVVNDADTVTTTWMQINRTGTTVDSVSIGGGTNAEGLRVTPVASAVNYIQVMGSAASGAPSLRVAGSDTNIPFGITSKGTGSVLLYTGNFARAGLVVANTASSVNHLVVYPNVTGSGPIITVDGADTNTNLTLQAKGTGIVRITSRINLASLPTSAAGLAAGDLWNDSGTLKVA